MTFDNTKECQQINSNRNKKSCHDLILNNTLNFQPRQKVTRSGFCHSLNQHALGTTTRKIMHKA